MSAPLAEIIEEGRRLRSSYDRATEDGLDSTAHMYWDELCEFWDEHGPLLLRVAEAAVEMRRAYDYALPILFEGPGGTAAEIEAETMMCEADAAFDSAARGAGVTAPRTLPGCGCHPWAKAQCFCAAHARMIGLPVHPDAVAVRVYGGRIRIARWRRLAGAGKLRSGV